jgi:GAF domain-containing protein
MSEHSQLQLISGRLERGETTSGEFLEEIVRFVASQVGCSRAGVRLMTSTPQGRVLRCMAMYDTQRERMVATHDLLASDDAPYVKHLVREGFFCSNDAQRDANTTSFTQSYLEPANVASLLDAAFSVNGELFGTFSCEHLGRPVAWTQRQLQSLRTIAARASLTLVRAVSTTIDTAPGALWEGGASTSRLSTMPMPLLPRKN